MVSGVPNHLKAFRISTLSPVTKGHQILLLRAWN